MVWTEIKSLHYYDTGGKISSVNDTAESSSKDPMTPRGQAHSSERTRWSLSRLVSRYNQVQHLCGEHCCPESNIIFNLKLFLRKRTRLIRTGSFREIF